MLKYQQFLWNGNCDSQSSLSIGKGNQCVNEIEKDLLTKIKGRNIKEPCCSSPPLLRVKYGRQYQSHQLIVHNAT